MSARKPPGKKGGKQPDKKEEFSAEKLASPTSDRCLTYSPQTPNIVQKNGLYEVFTYQVPVPVGDCSIHLLVQNRPNNIPAVISAFIMDGGKSGEEAAVQIKLALKAIDDRFGEEWYLWAWVVTHWDEDHYAGMMQILEDLNNGDLEHLRVSCFGKNNNLYLLCGDDGSAKDNKDDVEDAEDDDEGKAAGLPVQDILDDANPGKKVNLIFKQTEHCAKNLVGLDLFEGLRCFRIDGTACNLSNETRPRFCCLGAGGYGIGCDTIFKPPGRRSKKPWKPSKNETSIQSLLYWPPSKDKTKRCSYYTGGDGHPALVNALIVKFLEKNGFERQIKVVKLDHHGSIGEFSKQFKKSSKSKAKDVMPAMNMTVYAKPDKVLVTPGDQYGHPCWDVILFLAKFFEYVQHRHSDILYTTRLPYWLDGAEDLTLRDINFSKARVKKIDSMIQTVGGIPDEDPNWLTAVAWNPIYMNELILDAEEEKDGDEEELGPESRNGLAFLAGQLWNEIAAQRVVKGHEASCTFFLLEMRSTNDNHDGDIKVFHNDGKWTEWKSPKPGGDFAPTRPKSIRTLIPVFDEMPLEEGKKKGQQAKKNDPAAREKHQKALAFMRSWENRDRIMTRSKPDEKNWAIDGQSSNSEEGPGDMVDSPPNMSKLGKKLLRKEKRSKDKAEFNAKQSANIPEMKPEGRSKGEEKTPGKHPKLSDKKKKKQKVG